MAKKRAAKKRNPLEDKANQAKADFVNAYSYNMVYDPSAEMRRRVLRAEQILDMRWAKYQESLVADAKKNRRKP